MDIFLFERVVQVAIKDRGEDERIMMLWLQLLYLLLNLVPNGLIRTH